MKTWDSNLRRERVQQARNAVSLVHSSIHGQTMTRTVQQKDLNDVDIDALERLVGEVRSMDRTLTALVRQIQEEQEEE